MPKDEPIIQTVAEPLHQYLQKAAAASPGQPTSSPPAQTAANQSPPAQPAASPVAPSKVMPFRASQRQPLAMLTILDDGSREEGETIRIRDSKFTLGREKGDVTIPFDSDMSGQHAQLRCQKQKGRFRWFLIDLSSTNGTFLRAFRASLTQDAELILGSRRYVFQLPDHQDDGIAETDALQTQAYRAPTNTLQEQFVPRLVESGVQKQAARAYPITGKEATIGSDVSALIAIDGDPFMNPIHARIYQNETDRWMIDDKKSLNGVWIRVKKFPIDRPAEFQLGQQRFKFRPTVS